MLYVLRIVASKNSRGQVKKMFGKIEVDWKVEKLKPLFSGTISNRSKIITKIMSIFLRTLVSFDSDE